MTYDAVARWETGPGPNLTDMVRSAPGEVHAAAELDRGWIRLVMPSGAPQAIRLDSISEILGPYEFVPGHWVVQLTFPYRRHEPVGFGSFEAAAHFVESLFQG